ncbi:tRNA methyltransferase 10 homolog B isoform X3 [Equus przewalskii]|uniref:tRNA (guanine(9)-N(1))-methyltransferase n=1 Tax=Equus przewalskii TaxID=9798 RepID=A0ABM2EG09_EQUPR|nr:tRNA methyltransferase 10 homolog B isoform X3 [Equus caballus]XP_008506779.1 PREDICTED: tRNA methyltransferase 10 homolog B isoform X3 [Equus przewalskii]
MDWKLEGSPQKTESHVLQEQEVLREDTGEYGMSESFQLLQIDVECERQEGETLPTGGAVLCSVSAASCLVTGFEKNVQRKQRHWEKIVAAKKSKRKQEKERRKANRVENLGICPQHSKRFLRSLTKERLLEAKHSGPRLCIDLSMSHHMSKKLDITEEDCFTLFPLETLVYLTPDSEHALEDVDLNKVYILGGLVDESVQKKVTFQKAREHSVKTARLPIQEYMVRCQNGKNYHSEILAINQVFDILSTYSETQSWPEALKKGVSSRKGYVLQNAVE